MHFEILKYDFYYQYVYMLHIRVFIVTQLCVDFSRADEESKNSLHSNNCLTTLHSKKNMRK